MKSFVVLSCLYVIISCFSSVFTQDTPDPMELSNQFLRDTGHSYVADILDKMKSDNTNPMVMEAWYDAMDTVNMVEYIQARTAAQKRKERNAKKSEVQELDSEGETDDQANDSGLFGSLGFTTTKSTISDGYHRLAQSRYGDFMRFPYASANDLATTKGYLRTEACGLGTESYEPDSASSAMQDNLSDTESAKVADDVCLAICDGAPEYPFPLNSGMCAPMCVTGIVYVSIQDQYRREEECYLHKKMQLAFGTLNMLVESANHVEEMRRLEIERLIVQDSDLLVFRTPSYGGGGRLDTVGKIANDLAAKFATAAAKGATAKTIADIFAIQGYVNTGDTNAKALQNDDAYFSYKSALKTMADLTSGNS